MTIRPTIVLFALAALVSVPAFAQNTQNVQAGAPNAADIGKDQAQQLLKEVSVDKFEDAAFWSVGMPLDMGIASAKRLQGSPGASSPFRMKPPSGSRKTTSTSLASR